MGNWRRGAKGGSGAGLKGLVYLEKGNYTLSVGTGGTGYTQGRGDTCAPTDGGDTVLKRGSTEVFRCGGGKGARAWDRGSTTGAGGTVTHSLTFSRQDFVSNGSAGSGGQTDLTPGVWSGHTYGCGSGFDMGYAGGGSRPAKHGYFSLTLSNATDVKNMYYSDENKVAQHIRRISYGNYNIREIWKGDVCVFRSFEYDIDSNVYTSAIPVEYSFTLQNTGYYEIVAIGGGGPGAGTGGGGDSDVARTTVYPESGS